MKTDDIDILVCEVGLRDGLQNVQDTMSTEMKKAWIAGQVKAGFREMEVCSFVPPQVIKGMDDAAEIVDFATGFERLSVTALAPNLFGAENAIKAGADKISLPVSVSESHSKSNVKKTRQQMIEEVRKVCELRDSLAEKNRPKIETGLSTAFGCSIEGRVSEYEVLKTAVSCVEAGVDEVVLSDTIGIANPKRVKRLFKVVKAEIPTFISSVHLHDTCGLGLANALAAIDAGATGLDSSLGGLGGCPFAPGASGNIVTEDLVYMLNMEGFRTGIDLKALLRCREIIREALPNERLYGSIANLRHLEKSEFCNIQTLD